MPFPNREHSWASAKLLKSRASDGFHPITPGTTAHLRLPALPASKDLTLSRSELELHSPGQFGRLLRRYVHDSLLWNRRAPCLTRKISQPQDSRVLRMWLNLGDRRSGLDGDKPGDLIGAQPRAGGQFQGLPGGQAHRELRRRRLGLHEGRAALPAEMGTVHILMTASGTDLHGSNS